MNLLDSLLHPCYPSSSVPPRGQLPHTTYIVNPHTLHAYTPIITYHTIYTVSTTTPTIPHVSYITPLPPPYSLTPPPADLYTCMYTNHTTHPANMLGLSYKQQTTNKGKT